MTSSASWPRASGHDLDLPDAHLVPAPASASRRDAPSRASRAGPALPPRRDHRRARAAVSASSPRSSRPSRSSPSGERAERPEDRGRIDGELRDADRAHAVEQHPSRLRRSRRGGDRSPGTDEQVDRSDRRRRRTCAASRMRAAACTPASSSAVCGQASPGGRACVCTRSATAASSPASAASRATRPAAPAHVRDAGQAAGRVQAGRDRAVRLRQRPDRAAGAEVDRQDAEGRPPRRSPRRRAAASIEDRCAWSSCATVSRSRPLEVLAEVSALLAMRRRAARCRRRSRRPARTARATSVGQRARSRPTRPGRRRPAAPPRRGRPPPARAGCGRRRSRPASSHASTSIAWSSASRSASDRPSSSVTTSATSQPAASAARRAAPPESSRETATTARRPTWRAVWHSIRFAVLSRSS